jgi:molybdopterin converting factor subunit 1
MEQAAPAIRVSVLFFGRLKEIVGNPEHTLEIVEGSSLEELFSRCAARYPELTRYRSSLVATRNREFSPWETPLHAGDEIAFLPPVSGG